MITIINEANGARGEGNQDEVMVVLRFEPRTRSGPVMKNQLAI
jgi:hypothetical protein